MFSPLLGPSAEDEKRRESEAEERSEMLESYKASTIRSESKRAESASSLPSLEDASPAPTLTQEILEKKEEERKHSKKKEESRESAETEERETQRKPSKQSEASSKILDTKDFLELSFSDKIKYLEKKGDDPIKKLRTSYLSLGQYSDDDLRKIKPTNLGFQQDTDYDLYLNYLYEELKNKDTKIKKEEEEEKEKKQEKEKKEQKEADRIGKLYNKNLIEEINALGGKISSKANKEELVAYLLTLKNIKATPTIIGRTSSRARSQERTGATGSSASQKRGRSRPPPGGGLGRSSNLPPIPK